MVYETIQNGISEGEIQDVFIPVFYAQVSDHSGGSGAMPDLSGPPGVRCPIVLTKIGVM